MKLCYTIIISLIIISSEYAQNSNPFDKITIGIDAAVTVYDNTFKEYWNSGNAFGLSASTPFYYGNFDIGLIYNPFYAKDEDQPNFTGLLLYLQWSEKIFSIKETSLSIGLSAGLFQMIFDKTEEYFNHSDLFEHEITIGLSALVSHNIENNLSANFICQYHTIYFRKKLSFIYIGASLRYSFNTPNWLKEFLD